MLVILQLNGNVCVDVGALHPNGKAVMGY